MANSTKKTQRDFFNELLANPTITDEQREFLQGRIAQLDKKSAGSSKPTATQVANQSLKDEIYANMVIDVEYTITDMIKQFECCKEFSNQKISALVNQLFKEKRIEKIETKRKSYFKRIA